MKKTILLTAALSIGLALGLSGQSLPEVDELYNDYSSGDGVMAMSLSHEMLDAVDLDFDWDEQMKHLSGDIYQIKFITFSESQDATKKIRSLDGKLGKLTLKEIKVPMDKSDTDLRFARIYGKKDNGYYENVVLLALTEDNIGFFVAINGKLKVEKQ